MIITDTVLVIRNARDKIQFAQYHLISEGKSFVIKRFTGQFGGKITEQPEKWIHAGKSKRTIFEQAELEYNSLIKKSVDKGYKKLSSLTKIKFEVITTAELDSLVPSIKTDNNGNIKPQLAKSSTDCTINIWEKGMFCSRKLDGVRCLMKLDEDGVIRSISRGGGDYDVSTTEIREDPKLIALFEKNPDIILDGELYVHGWSLQKISGAARLKTWDERCSFLEYWVYDIADVNENFNERIDKLIDFQLEFGDYEKIRFIDHEYIIGWAKIKKAHDRFVSEGFEGLVARKPDKKYAPGRRSSDWIKLKDYQDSEFEIVGIEEGLRDEDFCFVLKSGKNTFKAKPMGSREVRYEYLENWESYVGKMAVVKYFAISDDGIPTQPIFKSIREDGE